MDMFIINTNATYIKNILISEDYVKVTDGDYKTKEDFLEKFNGKKGILDTQHQIIYNNIEKIVLYEDELAYQLYFQENDKNEMCVLHFTTLQQYNEVLDIILSKTNLKKSEVKIRTRTWVKPAVYTLISAILTFALFMSAKQLEAGEKLQISGSRRGLKKIMLQISEYLGSTNALLLGGIVTCGFIYYAYNAYQKSTIKQEAFIN
ncbi:hypothetical protein JBL43_11370 [Aureibaculum sp. A20]|uniref:Uncharacterized protein n=1 Tax=Aureibaculum flavum TaxID=2795986 RepID=A0ABS0WS75_9FLAO|nr:hypothetical protein [Aureibaculum flavum]MBJ2174840.1 hypothetical protein [Aureibaculum flavum]